MRKTVLYLVILAVLAFGVYYFLFNNDHGGLYPDSEAGFTIKDTGSIGKLFLVNNTGESILVERTDSGWMVNKKYRALPSTLNSVLQTLYAQAALSPVTKNAYENVVKLLSTDGIKVEVYGRDGKKMKVFYVGGASVNNIGTNMMIEGAKTPYVVQVPGFNGYLTPRFTTKVRDWRDRTVFNIAPEEIKSVSLQYADKPINSFVITRENGKLVVKGDPSVTTQMGEMNTRRVDVYMKYFTNVNCEGYLNGLSDMDTTIKTAPKQSSLDIESIHGKRQHIDIYWMAINRRSKNQQTSNAEIPDDYDADRLYAVINDNKDTVMIQHFIFRKIFRKAFEFYQKDGPAPTTPDKEMPRNVLMHKGA
ncbi:MAG: hypothetical protein JWQ38_3044 [Flavipsychrobacter sp.]|nr:hypothetical protein [Flavipsychrobacter sp.]